MIFDFVSNNFKIIYDLKYIRIRVASYNSRLLPIS